MAAMRSFSSKGVTREYRDKEGGGEEGRGGGVWGRRGCCGRGLGKRCSIFGGRGGAFFFILDCD